MNVELPNTGCNILVSDTAFYNYSDNYRNRDTYYIYQGVAHKQSSTYNQYGYTVTGTCLTTGDLIYKPELKIYMPVISAMIIGAAFILAYKIVLGRFLK